MSDYLGISMNSRTKEAIICLLIVAASIFVIVLCVNIHYKSMVCKFSTRLRILNSMNSQYFFHTDIFPLTYNEFTETKRQYDRFDFDGYMQAVIRENMDFFTNQIDKCEYNRDKYAEYINMVQLITTDFIQPDALKCNININTYINIENKLMNQAIRKPVTCFGATCCLSYTSPKGRSFYRCNHVYNYEDIKINYHNAKRKKYTKESIAYERSIVSDSLRYDIFKRDNFMCQICGRSKDDGVVLHVDHIVPVSKGGKSVPQNLRTLCDRCNMGKSNKYDPNGLN